MDMTLRNARLPSGAAAARFEPGRPVDTGFTCGSTGTVPVSAAGTFSSAVVTVLKRLITHAR